MVCLLFRPELRLRHEASALGSRPPLVPETEPKRRCSFDCWTSIPRALNLSIAKFRWHENRWESSVYTTEIYPYLKRELESALKSVGFAKLDAYRNYNFEDYDPNGSDIVLIAQKKGVLKSKNSGRRDKLASRPEAATKPARKELPSKPAAAQPSKAKAQKPKEKTRAKRKK